MSDNRFQVEVDLAIEANLHDELCPTRFRLGGRTVEVAERLDHWPGIDHDYVKVRGTDGSTYVLRHDGHRNLWQLVLFQRAGQAVFSSASPSSDAVSARSMNFCTLPVTVVGKLSTKRM